MAQGGIRNGIRKAGQKRGIRCTSLITDFAVFPLKIRFFVLSETQFMNGYGPR